jgi:hypothetical protein
MTEPRIRTCTVIDALLDVHERLRGLQLPFSSDTHRVPTVYFLGFYTDLTDEFVHLVGKVPDSDLTHAGAGPAAREETYVLHIRVGSLVRGVDGPAALCRLQEITSVVEAAFRDQSTGQPIPPDLGGSEVIRGGIERFEIDGYASDVGAAAVADIYIRVYARI